MISPENLLKPIIEQTFEDDTEPQITKNFALSDKQKLNLGHIIAADD